MVSIPDLFRTTRLSTSPKVSAAVPAAAPATSPLVPSATTTSFSAALQKPAPPTSKASSPLSPTSPLSSDDTEVIQWETAVKSKKKDRDYTEWTEASKKASSSGKGKSITGSVRNLKPRPCHTYFLSPWGCKAGDDCDYAHDYSGFHVPPSPPLGLPFIRTPSRDADPRIELEPDR